jgi:MFS family permease
MLKLKTLILISFGHFTGHWYIGVLMLILPLLKSELALSFTQIGLIISIRSLASAFGNTSSGVIVDLVGKRNLILAVSAAGMGLCWFVMGFAQSYGYFLILIPLATTFSNLWHAPAMSFLSETYPDRKGFVLGIHGMAANMGQSIAPLVVGLLITWLGWRTALKLNMAPGVVMAGLLVLLLPRLGSFALKKKSRAAFFALLKEYILKNPTLLMISTVSAFRTMGQRGIETFLALFLADRVGLDPVWIGIYLSILTFSSTLPEPLFGWLSDKIGRRAILAVSLTLSGLAVVAITLVPAGLPMMVSVGLLGFFHYSLRPIIFAFALDVTPPEIGATTVSYVFAWNQTFSAISPILGGFLADAFGLRYAMFFIAGLTLTAALLSASLKEAHGRSGWAFLKTGAGDRS